MQTAAELARTVPGGAVSGVTIWRWARRGLRSRGGKLVRLEHVRAGRKLLFPDGALERFFRELAEADLEHFDALIDQRNSSCHRFEAQQRGRGKAPD